MRTSSSIALVTMALALAACGDDGDGVGGIDASTIDSPPGTVDARTATSELGKACTGNGQGNCAVGYTCLNLGGSGSWCSKRCADIQDPSCEDGYTGPGSPACAFSIDFMGGEQDVPFCAVFCDDAAGGPILCPDGPTQCNGTCPGSLQCTRNVTPMNMPMQVLGKACF